MDTAETAAPKLPNSSGQLSNGGMSHYSGSLGADLLFTVPSLDCVELGKQWSSTLKSVGPIDFGRLPPQGPGECAWPVSRNTQHLTRV
jgi:hypothetical protein